MKEEAAEFGLELLEQFFVPVDQATDIGNCEATIHLKVTDSDLWGPSSPDDDPWDDGRKQLTEVHVFFFYLIMHKWHKRVLPNYITKCQGSYDVHD